MWSGACKDQHLAVLKSQAAVAHTAGESAITVAHCTCSRCMLHEHNQQSQYPLRYQVGTLQQVAGRRHNVLAVLALHAA